MKKSPVSLLWYGMHVFALEQADLFNEGEKLALEGFEEFDQKDKKRE